jgi:uracil DNA glycosylase
MVTKTKLNWVSFKEKFASWAPVLKPGFDEGLLDEVFAFLKKRNKEVPVYPSSEDVFKAFQLCDYKDLKLVIAVEGPMKGGDGLALSARDWDNVLRIPGALEGFYASLEKAFYDGLCLECVFQNDLSYLARQGVLLLNVPMTGDSEGAHQVWKPFIEFLFREVLSFSAVPVLFIGENTFYLQEHLAPWQPFFLVHEPSKAEEPLKELGAILKKEGISINFIERLPF